MFSILALTRYFLLLILQLCSSEGVPAELTAVESALELHEFSRAAVIAAKAGNGRRKSRTRRGRAEEGRGSNTEEQEEEDRKGGEDEHFQYSGPSLPWPDDSPGSAMRFVCDVSLEGLAKVLRLCGVDAASPRRSCPEGKDVQQWVLEVCCKREVRESWLPKRCCCSTLRWCCCCS